MLKITRLIRARLVAKGFMQKQGIRFSTITRLVALVVNIGLNMNHLDVKTAFLNDLLKQDVYMRQSEGFVVTGSESKV